MGASSCSRCGGFGGIGGLGSGKERLGIPDELSPTRSTGVETIQKLFEKEEIVKGAAALQGTQRRNRRIRNRSSVMYVLFLKKHLASFLRQRPKVALDPTQTGAKSDLVILEKKSV